MGTITLQTTQNIELEYELAGLSDRIFARLLDYLCIAGYAILMIAIIGFGAFSNFVDNHGWIILLLFLPILFYHLVCETLFNGQSIGKMVLKIRVISLNGNQPALSQYLMRWLFRLIDFTLTSSLLALMMVALTEKHQRLGDLVAGTTVIKTKRKASLSQTIYTPMADPHYQPLYPEVVHLSDKDMQLIREVVLSATRYSNTMILDDTARKIEQVLQLKNKQETSIEFLYTILKDYNYLTASL